MVVIRPAGIADVPGILEVGRATWAATYEPLAGADYVRDALGLSWTDAGIRAGVEAGAIWVVVDHVRVLGMVMLGVEGRVVDIWKLYVSPEHQRSGLGWSLLVLRLSRSSTWPTRLWSLSRMAIREHSGSMNATDSS